MFSHLVSGNQAVVHPLALLKAAPKAGHHVRVHLHQVEPGQGPSFGGHLGVIEAVQRLCTIFKSICIRVNLGSCIMRVRRCPGDALSLRPRGVVLIGWSKCMV